MGEKKSRRNGEEVGSTVEIIQKREELRGRIDNQKRVRKTWLRIGHVIIFKNRERSGRIKKELGKINLKINLKFYAVHSLARIVNKRDLSLKCTESK